MNHYLFYVLNIVLFSLPLALFEISVEKAQGWGGGLSKEKWLGKSSIKGTFADKVITMITGFESPLNYHLIIMFVFCSVFVLEFIFGSRNIFLIVACLIGANFFADFFWFSFNWYFHSMKELLKGPNGSIYWHKKWIKIGKESYIPQTYPIWFFSSIVLLLISLIKF
jgi:hypothetical protein